MEKLDALPTLLNGAYASSEEKKRTGMSYFPIQLPPNAMPRVVWKITASETFLDRRLRSELTLLKYAETTTKSWTSPKMDAQFNIYHGARKKILELDVHVWLRLPEIDSCMSEISSWTMFYDIQVDVLL